MSPFIRFRRTDGQTPDSRFFVTLRSAALAFNVHFIRNNRLEEQSRISVFCDASRYRLGLHFHSDLSDHDSFALTTDGGSTKGGGRAAQIGSVINQHSWLRAASKCKNSALRRYTPIWDSVEKHWTINIRPSFETRVKTAKEIGSGLCGIYRYWANDQLVYIGRGDIRGRANSPERIDWVIDAIEFSVIDDSLEQEKWESLWLDEYRNEHGALPLYNRIGGKRGVLDE
jgi:hypothetical protein